ncbi:peptidase S8/S53 domain-containing protein [Podospora australis]|uniref:Peptidase S8/S53 domain-containing protein n=1 Tax=Podospora australis TaxID=1536484 RepID=A0AAN6WPS3_9PEZI|nr:peptidase S8/S53 domain-containing protein [Podospora australis]
MAWTILLLAPLIVATLLVKSPDHHFENEYLIQYHSHVKPTHRQIFQAKVHADARFFGDYTGVIKTFSIEQVRGNTKVQLTGATWGQTRLSHRFTNSTTSDFTYDTAPLAPIVYMIDSGIRIIHDEFQVDNTTIALFGANFVPGSTNDTDKLGHGTHTAATIAGKAFGIARPQTAQTAVRLVALKVLDARGNGGGWDGVVAAIEWAAKDTLSRKTQSLSIINLSLDSGGGPYSVVNQAISAAVNEFNITVVVAAGNSDESANTFTPASCQDVITVAALDENDQRADFSNWGPTVDIFAPGVGVQSAS